MHGFRLVFALNQGATLEPHLPSREASAADFMPQMGDLEVQRAGFECDSFQPPNWTLAARAILLPVSAGIVRHPSFLRWTFNSIHVVFDGHGEMHWPAAVNR